MSRVGFGKKLFVAAAMVALGASATVTKAATVTFATFSDSVFNKWSYSNATGALTATADVATFNGAGGGVVNFSGSVNETLSATALGAVVINGTDASQAFSGTLTFKDVITGKTVLQVVFADAILDVNPTGTTSTTSSFSADDSIVPNAITSFSTDPSYLIGSFAQPLKFSFGLSTIPGLTVSGNNFASFTATAGGPFQVDQSGASPTPLPPAAFGGMSLMGAIGGVGAFIKRRRR